MNDTQDISNHNRPWYSYRKLTIVAVFVGILLVLTSHYFWPFLYRDRWGLISTIIFPTFIIALASCGVFPSHKDNLILVSFVGSSFGAMCVGRISIEFLEEITLPIAGSLISTLLYVILHGLFQFSQRAKTRWNIRLTTVVVVVFFVGGSFVALNTIGKTEDKKIVHGWPMAFLVRDAEKKIVINEMILEMREVNGIRGCRKRCRKRTKVTGTYSRLPFDNSPKLEFSKMAFSINISIGIGILICTALATHYWLRSRNRPFYQFEIKSLIILTTVVAIALSFQRVWWEQICYSPVCFGLICVVFVLGWIAMFTLELSGLYSLSKE